MTIHLLDPKEYSLKSIRIYSKFCDLIVTSGYPSDSEILVTRLSPITKEIIDEFKNLKIIGTSTTGLDHIDVEYAESKGIKVLSLNDAKEEIKSITSTAEHTFGLMLALARNYKKAFQSNDRYECKGYELQGKTLGIMGLGRVGQMVGKYGMVFGMPILGVDKKYDIDNWLTVSQKADIKDLLPLSDFVSIHIPLKGNENLITKEMIDLMKPSAYLINTSRGEILAEGVLEYACEKLAGVAVDVIRSEEESFEHPKLIRTPHVGGCTEEGMEKSEVILAKTIEKYLNNKSG